MLRFSVNRSWAFVLTLCLFTTCFTIVQPPSVGAASPSCFVTMDSKIADPQLGDPDVPTGPGEGRSGSLTVGSGGAIQVVQYNQARRVDDGVVLTSVVMDRVHLFLLSLRSLYLRF